MGHTRCIDILAKKDKQQAKHQCLQGSTKLVLSWIKLNIFKWKIYWIWQPDHTLGTLAMKSRRRIISGPHAVPMANGAIFDCQSKSSAQTAFDSITWKCSLKTTLNPMARHQQGQGADRAPVTPKYLRRFLFDLPIADLSHRQLGTISLLSGCWALLGHASIFGRMAEQMQTVRFSDVLMQTIAKWSSHQGKWIFFWTLQIIVNREMQILSPEPCRLQAARFNTTGISARCYTQELIGSGGILTLFINHSKQGPCHIYFLLNFGQWSPSPTRSHCQIKNWHQHLSRSTPYPSIFCRIRNYLLDSLSQLRR
jgi:hypothetical protein